MLTKLRHWWRKVISGPFSSPSGVERFVNWVAELPPDDQQDIMDKVEYLHARRLARQPELLLARFLSLDESQQDIAWRWVKALRERTAPARSARTEVADRRAVASICQHHGDRAVDFMGDAPLAPVRSSGPVRKSPDTLIDLETDLPFEDSEHHPR